MNAKACGRHHQILEGDLLSLLPTLPDHHFDAVLCDPPYHLTQNSRGGSGRKGKPGTLSGCLALGADKGFMGKCYHPETDVMTDLGWVPVHKIIAGCKVATLDVKTMNVEWQAVDELHEYDFTGDMIHIKHRSGHQAVTGNHNALISKNRGTTWEFCAANSTPRAFHLISQSNPVPGRKDDILIKSTRRYGTDDREAIEEQLFNPEKFFMFFGLWLGDGYVVKRKNDHPANDFFGFTVLKGRKVLAIRNALDGIGIKYKENKNRKGYTVFYCYNFALLGFLAKLGKAKEKHIPEWLFSWDWSLLEKLYEGLIQTDGNTQKDGRNTFFTSSERLADDFQRLCFYIGTSATKKRTERVSVFSTEKPYETIRYSLSVSRKAKILYCETSNRNGNVIHREPYSGKVFCPGVRRHHTLYTRFHGKPVWSGNSWDGGDIAFRPETWESVMRVMKPGAYLMAFGGSRTFHRMAVALEDAGFILVDTLMYLYGNGFPKSRNVAADIDKIMGGAGERSGPVRRSTYDGAQRNPAKRGNPADQSHTGERGLHSTPHGLPTVALETPEGQQFAGYGTALKPAYEPILLCRKPGEKTYAENALKWGCGALNIDGGRIGVQGEILSGGAGVTWSRKRDGKGAPEHNGYRPSPEDRWPANVMLDEAAAEMLDAQSGNRKSGAMRGGTPRTIGNRNVYGTSAGMATQTNIPASDGGASRFFYVSKVSTRERQAGVSGGNDHPTMKPIDLTRQLATLLLPPARHGGEQRRLLVPFSGSGSEMIGALLAGWDDVTGIEQSAEYARIAQQRIAWWTGENIMGPCRVAQDKNRLHDRHKDGGKI